MTSFAYRAVHKTGRVQKGLMTAANENELAAVLRKLDLELIEARGQKSGLSFRLPERIDPRGRAALCGQLQDLLAAGLPFAQALDLVIEAMPPDGFRTRLLTIAQALRAGASVHSAFAQHKTLFDPVFLALLDSGERSGDLASAFGRLAQQLRWQLRLRADTRRALRYPLFLAFVAGAVASFMMAFVVPEIVLFLTSLGTELPFATRLLIASAHVFAALWWSLPLAALAAFLGLFLARKTSESFKEKSDGLLLRLPGLGAVLRKLALARFATSLTALLASGLSPPAALGIAAGTFGNAFLAARAKQAASQIQEGRAFSTATAPLFPPFVLQMVKIGETSGSLPKTLAEIARLYETEAHEAVESFLGALEPALTLFVGGLLAWIVLAVLGPVYGSLSSLAGGV